MLKLSLVFSLDSKFMAIVDAGSSGSRLHLYEYAANSPLTNLKEIYHAESEPGLSTYANSPSMAYQSIHRLINKTDQYLAQRQLSTRIPLYVLATAGMRLLPKNTQAAIYTKIAQQLKIEHARYSIKAIETIPGEMEGLFGWLDVNYLTGTFKTHTPSVANLDMGGASTEIAYEINHPDTSAITIEINKKNYRIISRSYLGLGQDQARLAISQDQRSSACFPNQFDVTHCRELYHDLISTTAISSTDNDLKTQTIIANSGFYYTYHFLKADENPSQGWLIQQIQNTCQLSWDDLQKQHPNVPNQYLFNYCANASYFAELIYKTYLIDDHQLKVLNTINNQPIDWALGAAIYYLDA